MPVYIWLVSLTGDINSRITSQIFIGFFTLEIILAGIYMSAISLFFTFYVAFFFSQP